MLAEVLVFSLLAGTAALAHVYRVFLDLNGSSEFKLKLIETTMFGTVPGTVGIALGTTPASANPSARVVFLVFSSLFVLCLVLRYVLSGRQLVRFGPHLDLGTTASLVGVSVSVAVADGSGATASFCLTYLALFYFWVNDDGDDGATALRSLPSHFQRPPAAEIIELQSLLPVASAAPAAPA